MAQTNAFSLLPMGAMAVVSCIALGAGGAEDATLRSFTTGGHTVYHLRCAKSGARGDRCVVMACLDGAVLCYTRAGDLLWKNLDGDAFPLDLAVADIDGDGLDETLVVSGDGSLRVLDSAGKQRWRFAREAPLLAVCAISDGGKGAIILTGGIERKLYALSAEGKALGAFEAPETIRLIRAGNIYGPGKKQAAVVFAKRDSGQYSLQVFDPAGLKPLWPKPVPLTGENSKKSSANQPPFHSLLILDVNGDGKDDIALGGAADMGGAFPVYDYRGEKLLYSSVEGLDRRPYSMNLLSHARVSGANGDRILGLFGNRIILYRLDGSIERIVECPDSLTSCDFDQESNTLFLGSSVSGGDDFHALRLDRADWAKACGSLKPVGKIARVEENLALLARQIHNFKRPDYQRPPGKTEFIMGQGKHDLPESFYEGAGYKTIEFAAYTRFTEEFDRSSLEGVWKTKRDNRWKYDDTTEEIVAYAAEREASKQPFALWVGHGKDPYYLSRSTIQKILNTAPTMAKALIFAEMESTDADMAYAVRTHVAPLAEMCRKHGVARIFLRTKNVFWNATCYEDLWRDLLLTGRYSDIFVPSMEETNCRSQEISLSGRMGLWLAGHFDHISARAVTDNATFSRFWEWSAQQIQSHHLRYLALNASLGADIFLINNYQGDPRGFIPFFEMVDKGVIAIPRREELLSVSDVCLGMKTPSPSFMEHGANGHQMNAYAPGAPPAVFDRLDCYWGGAPTLPHDFSAYAMGSRRRMLNFLPPNPYGLIASVPAGADMGPASRFKSMLLTDGQVFFDERGRTVQAPEYKPVAEERLRAAAARLPILVRGEVAWTAVRLDPTHVRVTLIDSGYVDPADRAAEIVLQGIDGVACRDILSGEELPLGNGLAKLIVPAGVLRIIDITHK